MMNGFIDTFTALIDGAERKKCNDILADAKAYLFNHKLKDAEDKFALLDGKYRINIAEIYVSLMKEMFNRKHFQWAQLYLSKGKNYLRNVELTTLTATGRITYNQLLDETRELTNKVNIAVLNAKEKNLNPAKISFELTLLAKKRKPIVNKVDEATLETYQFYYPPAI